MPKEYSPFTPGQPVPVEFFVGRSAEIELLKGKIAATSTGRLQVAFLAGERGVGKSSLASFISFMAERDTKLLALHTFLGGVTSLEEMARRIFDRLLKDSMGKSWYGKIEGFFGKHIQKVGLFGVSVEFGAPAQDLRRMVYDFAPALRNLTKQLAEERRGILLVLDDLNGLATSEDFANWLKSLVDEIATSRQPLPLCILLVGLEERRHSLIGLQPSLARIFDVVELRPWTPAESRDFYQNAFKKAGMAADAEALELLVRYAGGLPVLAHEIGDAAFKLDTDDRIDTQDVLRGVYAAADIVGRKHLEPKVFQAIRSTRYRAILRKVANRPVDMEFKRSDLIGRLSHGEAKVLDNFLTKMKQLGVIRSDREAGPGCYRFDNLLHYSYFWLEAQRATETRIP
ncbi:MAG: ATP-binding protein [Planctomycetes bacterium]|nr:ATP-binding protein [Planctomycetota bacterium]